MIRQFPVAHSDELVGSVIARFINRQGALEDKVALDLLFGSRLVVPSALLQGHLSALMDNVGHLWTIPIHGLVNAHTVLPLFRPFVGSQHYSRLVTDLSDNNANYCMVRSGLIASSLKWPITFKVCPACWRSQLSQYGYTYWQRLFQCPGVVVCPKHQRLLVDTNLPLQSNRRHQFVSPTMIERVVPIASEIGEEKQIKLAVLVRDLLEVGGGLPEVEQWSVYYRRSAVAWGLCKGCVVDHETIARKVRSYWGDGWLRQHGLGLNAEGNWLVSMFRKHRRQFSYLQHTVCWMAINPEFIEVATVLREARQCPAHCLARKIYQSAYAPVRCHEYRARWQELLKQSSTLKKIRATREGGRTYSWLFRFDHAWLKSKLPSRSEPSPKPKVDWRARDLNIVRELLRIERAMWFDLAGPRRSKTWYCKQVRHQAQLENNRQKLPLCEAFFIRYAETVEEYQTRRLAYILSKPEFEQWTEMACYEIERKAGLSKNSCREPARQILRHCVPAWKGSKALSRWGTP